MTAKILVIGAGKSTPQLIRELTDHFGYEVTLVDRNTDVLEQYSHHSLQLISAGIDDAAALFRMVESHDIVISMLPHFLHQPVAQAAAEAGRHFLCASYVSDALRSLDAQFRAKNRILLPEMGLDPGIDHMSGMDFISRLRGLGYTIYGFESFTGGLISEENERNNPWKYKFTWNPRNVILAGQGHARFLQEGKIKYIPYHRLFRRTEIIELPGLGYFEGYPNRDSLPYIDKYELTEARTFFRGTLRRVGFCKAWNCLIQLGCTDDTYLMDDVDNMTHRSFINSFLSYNPHDSVELKLAHYLQLDLEGEEMHRLRWAGLFDEEPVGLKKGSPAQILEHILHKKWALEKGEKDRIVMIHKIIAEKNGAKKEFLSYLDYTGDDQTYSAMAKTVGLPLAITTRLIVEEKLTAKGLVLPYQNEIFKSVLPELAHYGIEFVELPPVDYVQ